MSDAFRPWQLLDTARFLHVHGAKAMAGLPSAQRIAAGVATSYDAILGSFRSASSRFDAATFLAPPSSSIATSDIADQWVGVTMPVDEIDLSPARLSVSANAAIFCLWLSLLEDIASGMGPAKLLRKEGALSFWLSWEERHARWNASLPFSFSPRDPGLSINEFARFQPIAA